MIIELPDSVVEYLRKTAEQGSNYDDDDFEVYSYSGGNIDDAYAMGETDGEVGVARLLADYLKPYVAENPYPNCDGEQCVDCQDDPSCNNT